MSDSEFTNTEARPIRIAGKTILPGKTETIPAKFVDAVKASPPGRAGWLKEGKVTMPPAKVPDISKQSIDNAKKLIAVEKDLHVLKTWIDAESRQEVLDAINARMSSL
jgi:uncharacterized protein YbaA (DUF1428 family)